MDQHPPQFDEVTWAQLPEFFEHLPEPVRLHVWGDGQSSPAEGEAVRLARALDERFEMIDHRVLPRRINYAYYPVIGVFRLDDDEAVDHGIRIIGLPGGYQLTSLIAAIQCVSFRGSTSEAQTRIQLRCLTQDVTIQLLTSADDEHGPLMAQTAFNMAVFAPSIRAFLIMADSYPEAIIRHSVSRLPHIVINDHVHLEGVVDEQVLLEHIASAVSNN